MMSTSSVRPKWAAVPSPLGPEHADRVGVVHGQRRAVLLGDAHQVRDVGDVAFHRVDAVHHDHRAAAVPGRAPIIRSRPARSPWLKRSGVAVGHLGAVDDRGVVELVEVDHLAPADQPGDEAEVGLVAGGEDEAVFLAQELGEGALRAARAGPGCRSGSGCRCSRSRTGAGPAAGGLEDLRDGGSGRGSCSTPA